MMWWAFEVLGLILAAGGLLAGVAALLPRVSAYMETPVERDLERIAPVQFHGPSTPLAVPPPSPARPQVEETLEAVLDPRIPAAISLALALTLGRAPQGVLPAPAPSGAASAWSLSGRWQAMAGRHHPRKR